MKVKLLSRVWLFVTLWTGAHQAPPFMEVSRQEYWSGLPFPSPRKGLFGWSLSVAWCVRLLIWTPWLGSISIAQCIRHLKATISRVILYSRLPALACGETEPTVMAPTPACDSALTPCLHGGQDFLQRHFPLWYPSSCPSGCLLTVNSRPCPGITLQFLWSSSSCHVFQGTCIPVQGM